MHMDEGQSLGLSISYELFDFDLMPTGAQRLAAVLEEAEQRRFTGLNVTYPSKQAVIPLLHELSPEARALHSVNTVLFRGGRRIGHNTDWLGFAESFRREMSDVNARHVVLVGAGGAGAAVGYALLKSGTQQLNVHDLDRSRAAALAERMSGIFHHCKATVCDDVIGALANADGLVHATPTGMQKYPGIPVPADCLRPRCGSPRSSMCRCSPSCYAQPVNTAVARWMAMAWRYFRVPWRSTCSSASLRMSRACSAASTPSSAPRLPDAVTHRRCSAAADPS
jgi:shikimate dehydrogenase